MIPAKISVFWQRLAGRAEGLGRGLGRGPVRGPQRAPEREAGDLVEESVFARMSGHDAEHWWFVARRRILREQIAVLGLPRGARILEAGCGPGGNLAMLAEFGEVTGCEPNEGARRIAEQRTGLPVRDATLPDDTLFPAESFDLVAAFDVIEHIEDDAGAVRSLAPC